MQFTHPSEWTRNLFLLFEVCCNLPFSTRAIDSKYRQTCHHIPSKNQRRATTNPSQNNPVLILMITYEQVGSCWSCQFLWIVEVTSRLGSLGYLICGPTDGRLVAFSLLIAVSTCLRIRFLGEVDVEQLSCQLWMEVGWKTNLIYNKN